MTRDPIKEWALLLAVPTIIDIVRNQGEPDGDTLSEVVHMVFKVDTFLGWLAFTATLAGGTLWFHRHICKDRPWLG